VDGLQDFLEGVFWKVPTCLTLFAAAVFALARWERHPAASVFAALGFGWLLLVTVAEVAWRTLLVPDLFPNPPPPTSLGESLSYVLFSILESAGLGCLVVAILIGRTRRRPPYTDDADHDFDDRH
jgi:hypothetical protein